MADIPQWIKMKGTLIPLNCQTSISSISPTSNNRIAVFYQDGRKDEFPYADSTEVAEQMTALELTTNAKSLDEPEIQALSESEFSVGDLPVDIFVTGINFDSTAVITASSEYNYGSNYVLATTWINSTTLKVTIDASVVGDTYDMVYSDSNGKYSNLRFALIIN